MAARIAPAYRQEFAELTIAIPFNDPEVLAETFQKFGEQIAAVIVEAVPANAGLFLPKPGFYEGLRAVLRSVRNIAYLRRSDDRVSRRQGRIPGDGRNQTRSHGDGEGHRRRSAGRGIWRSSRNHGFAISGRTSLSGWNSFRQSARDGGRARQLRELERVDGWTQLEETRSADGERGRRVLHRLGRGYQFNRIGSMFCLFFTEEPVWSFADAMKSDLAAFRKFFHLCLERGVYFAPSQFETGFLCLMHSAADVDQTTNVLHDCLSQI